MMGMIIEKVNFKNLDMYVIVGSSYLKLLMGGFTVMQGCFLSWFIILGGFICIFNNVEEVLLMLLIFTNFVMFFVVVKFYIGFVVESYLFDVYVRVWIEVGNEYSVMLCY